MLMVALVLGDDGKFSLCSCVSAVERALGNVSFLMMLMLQVKNVSGCDVVIPGLSR